MYKWNKTAEPLEKAWNSFGPFASTLEKVVRSRNWDLPSVSSWVHGQNGFRYWKQQMRHHQERQHQARRG